VKDQVQGVKDQSPSEQLMKGLKTGWAKRPGPQILISPMPINE